MRGSRAALGLVLFVVFGVGAWSGPLAAQGTPTAGARAGPQDVILATTTSTADTGLLDALAPLFQEATGYSLKPIAVGSGAALELGERGEADVVLAHSPAAELAFMDEGFGAERRTVMYNDFVVVGPADDPAGIAGGPSALEAMRRIAASESRFVSRGDGSGTNALERRLWGQAGVAPAGDWYVESGTGVGDTLNIASERGAYTIADRGTYLALRDRLDLPVLVEGDRALLNVYHVLTPIRRTARTSTPRAGRRSSASCSIRRRRSSSAGSASRSSASRCLTPAPTPLRRSRRRRPRRDRRRPEEH
jgi:tungstate transport system substrate-binding protein